MNVTMIYFSQTGNTRKVAETIAGTFKDAGHAVRTSALQQATLLDATSCDLLGIGTPTFSSQAPTPVKAFLRLLPPLDHQRAFVFATTGGAPGRVLYDLTHLLQVKGADVLGGLLVRGEVHHPAPCLIGRFPNRPDEEDLALARSFAAGIAGHAAAGRPGIVPGSRADIFRPGAGFYDLVAALSTDAFLRRCLPEPRLDPARCDQCQACIQECPVDNLSLQPYPVVGQQCIRCYRCLAACPQEAFSVGWGLSDPLIHALYNHPFERWFGDLKPGERLY